MRLRRYAWTDFRGFRGESNFAGAPTRVADLEKFSEFREGLMEAQVIWPGEEEEKGLESPVEEEVAPFGGESRGNWSEEEEDDGLPKLPGAED